MFDTNLISRYSHRVFFSLVILFFIISAIKTNAQQQSISVVDQMQPSPVNYQMRDWKKVALGYDSLVFNKNLTGEYLPLVSFSTNSINYPGNNWFWLQTVVGSTDSNKAEAINVLPAVVGASLCGVDKTNMYGYDWVKMCREWFNKNNGQGIYQNGPNANVSDDFWYETMPNVFFYQLYSLYPNTEDFDNEFVSIADKFLQLVKLSGGSDTPWKVPDINYQGWDFENMTPSPAVEHKEPEAAGAIAWILYNAYKVTGNVKYKEGAEWAMEYLNSLGYNPAYELQLPYGVYTAAKMNAELGTNYNIGKMINWCFNSDNQRKWGVVTGTWGGYGVSGLVGEENPDANNDYPFSMNTFEQIGALVPLVRYDERFATAIGKWVLNAASACRLFYSGYLPQENQDYASRTWAAQYDKNSFLAHEAMHQYNPSSNLVSPYASGDAVEGGWGNTNLSLYSSSHVGILGAIIDTTNVSRILRLDLLKTDYFHSADANPTYLYYNPYNSDKSVNIDVGTSPVDIYDLVSKNYLVKNISGEGSITIPAGSSVVAVLAPAGGKETYDLNKFLINGVVVDYKSGAAVSNYPPRIKSLASLPDIGIANDTLQIFCTAVDPDNDLMSYKWSAGGGTIIGGGPNVKWAAPGGAGIYVINCTVKDSKGDSTSATDTVTVVTAINNPPVINNISADPRKLDLGKSSLIKCDAADPDNDALTYQWSAASGSISGSGSQITWTAPNSQGNYYVSCVVSDGKGGTTADSIGLEVRDFSQNQTGVLEAYYPFNGNADDASGNGNNGTVSAAAPTNDRFGNPSSAYYFDGIKSNIQVPESSTLNFQKSISINFWMIVNSFLINGKNQEQYIISQGSYDSRLKISIIPDKHLRWTIKTDKSSSNAIKDLDSETLLKSNTLYNVTVVYSGADIEIYINGRLDSFSSWSGNLLQTQTAMTIGQMLPNDNSYNFNGVLDDIRIYNYALSPDEIKSFYDISTGIDKNNTTLPTEDFLSQNYPNPFNPSTAITFSLRRLSDITLNIYDVLGRKVAELAKGVYSPGVHTVNWDAAGYSSGVYYYALKIGGENIFKKMILLK